MKKLILIIALFLSCKVFSQSGTLVTAPVLPNSYNDNYATHVDTLGFGGYRVIDSHLNLTRIKSSRLNIGMTVYCKDDSITYRLMPSGWEAVSGVAEILHTFNLSTHKDSIIIGTINQAIDINYSISNGTINRYGTLRSLDKNSILLYDLGDYIESSDVGVTFLYVSKNSTNQYLVYIGTLPSMTLNFKYRLNGKL